MLQARLLWLLYHSGLWKLFWALNGMWHLRRINKQLRGHRETAV